MKNDLLMVHLVLMFIIIVYNAANVYQLTKNSVIGPIKAIVDV
jgi:hypothetical protein